MIENFDCWSRPLPRAGEPAAQTTRKLVMRAEPRADEKDFWKACPIGIVGGARRPVKVRA